eukprot:NODE_10001_length_1383_cov_11.965764.p1 GENE.NODE_10001_length_1383_cov_11.965764~~NODE_10001_length_1383_cov_11.965764.p1  ORF type:complete len:451 (-),score=68.45 NODE_10001_length_1383_cov_11.965764:31-1356(-)
MLVEVRDAGWASMEQAHSAFESALALLPREPLQSPWALFDTQGSRLSTLAELRGSALAFLLGVGQWMWPAVRIGFEQPAEGVIGDSPLTLRTLSLRPVIFEVSGFLLFEETDELLRLGEKAGLVPSKGLLQTRDVESGRPDADFRTSKQVWLPNEHSPVVERLDKRTANLTRIPASHNEPVQLLHYAAGEYYHGHMDWTELGLYPGQKHIWQNAHFGHQGRLATLFWYLNDVALGGETQFAKHGQPVCPYGPDGRKPMRSCIGSRDPDMVRCDLGLHVKPRRGTAILWYNHHPDGAGDRNALHSACPVGEGSTKWSANKWISIKPLNSPSPHWLADHPALEREGWPEGRAPAPANKCYIVFSSGFSADAIVYWVDGAGNEAELGTLRPATRLPLNSVLGHMFRLRAGSSETPVVRCASAYTAFELTEDFKLVEAPAVSQEL